MYNKTSSVVIWPDWFRSDCSSRSATTNGTDNNGVVRRRSGRSGRPNLSHSELNVKATVAIKVA